MQQTSHIHNIVGYNCRTLKVLKYCVPSLKLPSCRAIWRHVQLAIYSIYQAFSIYKRKCSTENESDEIFISHQYMHR